MMEYWNNGYGSIHHVAKDDDSWDLPALAFERLTIRQVLSFHHKSLASA
jgi:hypothetical protein